MTIDPKTHRCKCGMTFRPGLYHKIIMLLFNGYSWRCPQCGTVMKFRLINHVVKIETKKIPNKESVYRNG